MPPMTKAFSGIRLIYQHKELFQRSGELFQCTTVQTGKHIVKIFLSFNTKCYQYNVMLVYTTIYISTSSEVPQNHNDLPSIFCRYFWNKTFVIQSSSLL